MIRWGLATLAGLVALGVIGVGFTQSTTANAACDNEAEASGGGSYTGPLPEPGQAVQQAARGAKAGPVPRRALPIYEQTARKYRIPVALLLAIGWEETKHGTGIAVSSAGAQGWMQFMPATWRAYGRGGNPDNPRHAIPAAARYLVAAGAHDGQPGIRRAIFAYNHATWYVNDVLKWAKQYERRVVTITTATGQRNTGTLTAGLGCATSSSVAPEGSPKAIIDRIVLPIATDNGITLTPAQVDAANAAHSMNVAGSNRRSWHKGPPDEAWAVDISNGSSPTLEMDAIAAALARRFDLKDWDGSGYGSATRGGYSYQLIYRDGGSHEGHNHFGVKRVAR